ncbi:MAG: hypothetical protein AAGC67_21950, partial [Myxococcota bacterium]
LVGGGVVGVRIGPADPDGIDGQIVELVSLEAELAADAVARGIAAPGAEADGSGLVARMSATVRDSLGGTDESGPDPNRLVRCDLGGGVQFMRAADCQGRGGDTIDVDR